MAGERRRLCPDALHHAAVPANRIDIIVEDVEACLVVPACEPLLANGHADAGGDALPQRAGGGLDPRGPVVFRMPRGFAVELTETADVLQGYRRLSHDLVIGVHRLNPGEVKHGPEKHRGMTIG